MIDRIRRPEVCFLDVGDTLIRAHPSWPEVYLSAFPKFGLDISREDLGAAMKRATASGAWQFEGPFDATEAASFERIVAIDRQVLAELGHTDMTEALFYAIEDAFQQRSAWHVFPDVEPALDAMRAAGIRLGVISNWVWGAPELLHDLELASHFEELIISSRVGYQKPAPAIFERALDLMAVQPDRSIHVGDSYGADVLGARRAGIEPVLLDRALADPGRLEHTIPYDDDVPVISDLLELLDLISVPRPALEATG